jgi:hypothetical protein
MEPLQIIATLTSPLAVPLFPINLDGLLASMVCERQGFIAGVGEWQDVDVPLQRSACGRYYLASVGHYESAVAILGYTQKRSPISEFGWFGEAKIKSVLVSGGINKACRIPQPRAVVDTMRWWCIGDRTAVAELIALVTHLGKKRSVGHGRVARWGVKPCEPWPGFPVLRPDGTPMRNLPVDTEGLGPTTAIGWGPLTYPYWDQTRSIEVAQPPDVDWRPA